MHPEPLDARANATDTTAGWPTTLRFSRRLGETLRGADYAVAIEGPEGPPPMRIELGIGPVRRLASLLCRF